MTIPERLFARCAVKRPLVTVAVALGAISLAGAGVLAAVDVFNVHTADVQSAFTPLPQPAQPPRLPPTSPALAQATPRRAQAPASPAPAAAAPVRTETVVYDNWTVTCRDTVGGTAKKICSASFKMTEKERNAVIFSWTIGRNNEGALISLMEVPTGVFIQPGLQLKIDNGAARKLDFTLCDPRHCEASIKIDDHLMKDMLAAQTATVTLVSADGKGINFTLIPKGIDKAVGSLAR
jgi:invasion protein IalB